MKNIETQSFKNSLPSNLSQQKPQVITRSRAPQADAGTLGALTLKSKWEELKEQSVLAFESGLLPRSVDSRQKAVTLALLGKELGLTPMQALCGIYVVNGMAALRGSLMLRLIYERIPGAELTVLTPPEKADVECVVEMRRPQGKAHIFRFSTDDARKAGFMNKPIWQQHTSTMLRWAAIRTGARIVFADAIAGCYMEDEIANASKAPLALALEPELPELRIPVQDTKAQQAPKVAGQPVKAAEPAKEKQTLAARVQETRRVEESRKENPVPSGGVETYFASSAVTVSRVGLSRSVTEKQVNRLYAIAHQQNWTRRDVSRWIEKWFNRREAGTLTRFEYDKICNHLLATPGKQEEKVAQKR